MRFSHFRERVFAPPPRAEVDAELQFHLEERAREYEAQGMDPVAARAAARARLGDLHDVRAECVELLTADRRATERRDWMADVRQDVRHGIRAALRAPLFSLLAIVTLALGIGANAAVFRVVKSVLLDALPYADADRLVRVYARFDASALDRSSISPGAVDDITRRVRAFAGVAAFNFGTFDVAYVDATGARVLSGAAVGDGFFPTLGVRAALGRTLNADDAQAPVAMLSHAAWQREFAGDPGVIGRALRIDRDEIRVVGVLPRDFVGPMGDADLVFPMDLRAALRRADQGRGENYVGVVGRLARGATPQSARRELDRLSADLAREHPDTDRGRAFVVLPLRDALVGDTRTPLLVLMASAGLVLLITCANLAGALLTRTIARRNEFAVRVALGARHGRLVRQLLTESVLLSLAGAAIGLALAIIGLRVLRSLALPALPPYADLALDGGAVLATLLAALGTGIAFGLAPAVSVARSQPRGTLGEETRGTSESRRTRQVRGALVAAQIALSVSLLTGAGLLVRSLWGMTGAPLGFAPDGVLTARVQLPRATYRTPAERDVFFDRLRERFAALPGVRSVASVTQIPSPTMSSNVLAIDGVTLPGDGPTFIPYMAVSDDYFALMRVPLVRGRAFGAQDGLDAPPAIVVSETMARRFWPKGDALGAHVRISPHTAERWGVIVGIVRDVRVDPALPAPGPMAYATNRQDDLWNGRDFLLRLDCAPTATCDPMALVKAAQRTLASLDPSIPLRDPRTLRAIVDERLSGRRLPVVLMTAFGALALLLASVGVYAMFANMAAAREREFGVRVALGSSRARIAALVLRQGAAWMAAGLAGGLLGVALLSRFLRDLLYGVTPFDPPTLGGAAAVLLACAALALLGPIRRATRADAIAVMR